METDVDYVAISKDIYADVCLFSCLSDIKIDMYIYCIHSKCVWIVVYRTSTRSVNWAETISIWYGAVNLSDFWTQPIQNVISKARRWHIDNH